MPDYLLTVHYDVTATVKARNDDDAQGKLDDFMQALIVEARFDKTLVGMKLPKERDIEVEQTDAEYEEQ